MFNNNSPAIMGGEDGGEGNKMTTLSLESNGFLRFQTYLIVKVHFLTITGYIKKRIQNFIHRLSLKNQLIIVLDCYYEKMFKKILFCIKTPINFIKNLHFLNVYMSLDYGLNIIK
jgi:hypothetical protein